MDEKWIVSRVSPPATGYVGGFHDFLKAEGNRLKLGPELFGAKCVGRWASGAPIERAPLADNLKMSRDVLRQQRF